MPGAAMEPIPATNIKPLILLGKTGALAACQAPPLDAAASFWETRMAIDGKWEITINSPMGAQKAALDLKSDGASLSGTQTAQGATQPVANGKADGNTLTWSANITSPMPMTLEFTGNVEGEKMSGSVKAGAFGSFPFTGAKTA
jgi:hypothetical protein